MKNKLNKIILLLALCHFLVAPSKATELQVGGVSYDVNSARQYVQKGQRDNVEITGPFQLKESNVEKVVYSYNNDGEVIASTVQYINDNQNAYIYDRNRTLVYVEKYDRPVHIYPHRGYRYRLDGTLDLTSLTVSKNECFRFSPDGKLIAHSLNGTIYDENGNIIGKAK